MYSFVKNKLAGIKGAVSLKLLWWKYVRQFDLSVLNGKSIAIIGAADSIFEEKNGNLIDTYDIVVRVNKGINMIGEHAEYIGTKTTLLFNGLDERPGGTGKIDTELWKKNNVQSIIYPFNNGMDKTRW